MQEQDNLETKRIEEGVVDNTDYIAAIEELKKNSVSKEKYDALAAREKKLLEAVVAGQEISTSKQEDLEPRIEYYKKYKKNDFSTDLDYWTNMVNLRKATIKEYGADPCVTGSFGLTPEGSRIQPEYGEPETIAKQFEIIEDFIEQANGNSLVFETLMQSAMPRK